MASPLSRGLIAGAIGESGAALGGTPLALAEANGAKLGTLAALRARPAAELMDTTAYARFGVTIDGYFLPKAPQAIYEAGEQAHVPLLAGWNGHEGGADSVLGKEPGTPQGLANALRRLYPDRADDAIRAFPAATDAEAVAQATALASDRFIGFGTWKWTDLHAKTGGKPVYRYLYARARPGEEGANHSAEIEYALGNLPLNPHYPWTAEDRALSATMLDLWSNFVKRGDPQRARPSVMADDPVGLGDAPRRRLRSRSRTRPRRATASSTRSAPEGTPQEKGAPGRCPVR